MKQEYTSAKTSTKQVPRTHKHLIKYGEGFKNFDNGAGKYMDGTMYLYDHKIFNHRYDPFNVSETENFGSLSYKGEYFTSTIANVLNTIKEKEVQLDVLKRSYDMLREGGFCFICVYYDKNKSAGATRNGWQWHKPLKDYVPLVKEVFGVKVHIENNIIVAIK